MNESNIILDTLPSFLCIGENKYPIYTDFRNWIRFELLMTDGSLSDVEKLVPAVRLCYRERNPLPDSAHDMLSGILWFYRCGKSMRETVGEQKPSPHGSGRNDIYSFHYDADLIYAAFHSQYGIDLNTAKMHWWTFRALFRGLNEGERIVEIMKYRSVDISEIKDKSQKKFYEKMKRVYKLPDERSVEQKEEAFVAAMLGVF